MKPFRLLLYSLLLYPFNSLGQKDYCIKCFENPLQITPSNSCCNDKDSLENKKDTLSDDLIAKLKKREENFDFHYTLRKIQEPSTFTSFLTWHVNNSSNYQKKNFVLDADARIPISIGGKRMGLNEFQIIPRFMVRIFQNDPLHGDESLPVRTPSFIPGIAYYKGFRYHEGKKSNFLSNKYVGLYAFHHSNGQDGAEINKTTGEINTYNGNFGEDLVLEFIIGGKLAQGVGNADHITEAEKRIKSESKTGKLILLKTSSKTEHYWRLGYELHPESLTNKAFDSLGIYGLHRINFNWTTLYIPKLWELVKDGKKWCSLVPEKEYERWRFTGNLTYIADSRYYRGSILNLEKVAQFNLKKRLNIELTAYRTFRTLKYLAAFAQVGYKGSDNYNIYFNQSAWTFKTGFAFGFFDQPEDKDHLKK